MALAITYAAITAALSVSAASAATLENGQLTDVISDGGPVPALSNSESQTADVLVDAPAGYAVSGFVVPSDCDDPSICGYYFGLAKARDLGPVTGNALPEDESAPAIDPVATANALWNNKTGRSVRVVRRGNVRAAEFGGAKVTKLVIKKSKVPARKAVDNGAIRGGVAFNDDHTCSPIGCGGWEIQLNSMGYTDGIHAWGDHSHRGYMGYANRDGSKCNACSLNNDSVGFAPSIATYSDTYAYHSADVSASWAGGLPASANRYVHRHYNYPGTSWVVLG